MNKNEHTKEYKIIIKVKREKILCKFPFTFFI